MNVLIYKRFLVEFRLIALALVLPGSYIHVVLVIPLGLSFRSLALLAEMTSAGLIPVESVLGHELADIEEVNESESLLEFLVELIL